MNDNLAGIINLLGRLLLSAIFLFSAVGKIMDFEGTSGYMASKGMPMIPVFLSGAIVFLLIGSISVILGFKARIGAGLLVVFMIPTTLIFHNFWATPDDQMQMIQFMKNVCILGGLFQIIAFGSGSISLDAFLSKNNENRTDA